MDLDDFLKKFQPPGRVIFAKVWGSRSYNLHKETSDADFAGVYIHPTRDLLSVRHHHEPGPQDTWKHDKEDAPDVSKNDWPDYQFFEVGRFAELVTKGNPNLIEMLFTERMTIITDAWCELYAIRERFLSQEAVRQYVGYMQGQLRRLIAHDGKKGLHTTSGAYNEKWAFHIIRLAEDARRIASGSCPVVWKEGAERDFLMRVRNEDFGWQEVREWIEEAIYKVLNTNVPQPPWEEKKAYAEWLDKSLAVLPIPKHGDKDALNEWLLKLRKENW